MYNVLRCDRNTELTGKTRGGGVMIAIASVLALSSAQFLPWLSSGYQTTQIFPQPQLYQAAHQFPSFFYQTPQISAQQFYQQPQINAQFYHQPAQAISQINSQNIPVAPSSNAYRGFGYHTSFSDGASSTVVFFRGAGNNIVDNGKDSITIASDIQDPEVAKDIAGKIRKTLEESLKKTTSESTSPLASILNLTPAVKSLLQNPTPLSGLVHFYSAPGFPASTYPLNLSGFANTTESNSTVSTTRKPDEKEEEPAESVVTGLRLRFNSVNENDSKDVSTEASPLVIGSTTTSSSTTDSTTDTSVLTTERSSTSSPTTTTPSSTTTEAVNPQTLEVTTPTKSEEIKTTLTTQASEVVSVEATTESITSETVEQ